MTTIKNKAKQITRTLYIRGIIVGDENREKAEAIIESELKAYSDILVRDMEKKLRREGAEG